MPARENLPSTIRRSPKHAQDIYAETLDSATEQSGAGERAPTTM
jgi:cation transport regulator ChaB